MRIQDIEAFLSLAKFKHFGKAAESLHITQSALTRRIKSLESTLDSQLFIRSTRDVSLSPEGAVLMEHWEQAYVHIVKGLDAFKRAKSGYDTTVSIGFCTYACGTALASLVGHLQQTFPNSHVVPEIHSNEKLIELVLQDEIDFVFLESRYLHPKLAARPVQTLEYVLVVPDEHPLNQLPEIHFSDLNGQCVYTGNVTYWQRQWDEIETRMEKQGVACDVRQVKSAYADVMRAACHKNALALFPENSDFIPIRGMNKRTIVDFDMPLQIFVAWREASANSVVHAVAKILPDVDFKAAMADHG